MLQYAIAVVLIFAITSAWVTFSEWGRARGARTLDDCCGPDGDGCRCCVYDHECAYKDNLHQQETG